MTVEWVPCSPCQVAAEVALLMRVRAEAKGLPFAVEYIGSVPETIHMDPTRLRQILINLVGNAIKFTDTGGVRLIIRHLREGDASLIQFDVVDAGLGMSEEQVARLFQPFTQADETTTRKFGGTGLGLTISKRFAGLLGGQVEVVDSREGVGTRFRATVATGSLDGVRMIEDAAAATVLANVPEGEAAREGQLPLDGFRILMAEDGPDNQRLIGYVLRKAGAEPTIVENGQLAVDAAMAACDQGPAQSAFDVILMDMQMPVLDGYSATRKLRDEGYDGTIIALTAHAMSGERQTCIDAGCTDYATKPIDRKTLLHLIASYAQQHHTVQ